MLERIKILGGQEITPFEQIANHLTFVATSPLADPLALAKFELG